MNQPTSVNELIHELTELGCINVTRDDVMKYLRQRRLKLNSLTQIDILWMAGVLHDKRVLPKAERQAKPKSGRKPIKSRPLTEIRASTFLEDMMHQYDIASCRRTA